MTRRFLGAATWRTQKTGSTSTTSLAKDREMVRMKHRDYESDDEIFDDEVFDRRYYPKRVSKDGYGPRVPLYLTDGAMPHAHLLHRPGQVRLSDAQVDVRERALAAKSARVRDAWRGTPMAPDDRDVFEL